VSFLSESDAIFCIISGNGVLEWAINIPIGQGRQASHMIATPSRMTEKEHKQGFCQRKS